MVTRYHNPGPSTPFVIVAAIATVISCILVWLASVQFLGPVLGSDATATRQAQQAVISQPTFDLGPSPTPIPVCQKFMVNVDRTTLRMCPDRECEARQLVSYGQELCVYGAVAADDRYPEATAWLQVDINAEGIIRDFVYIHQGVVKAMNPTATPTRTFTPLPTITLTPTLRHTLTPLIPTDTPTPLASLTPTPEKIEF